jgi:hypothetical protein
MSERAAATRAGLNTMAATLAGTIRNKINASLVESAPRCGQAVDRALAAG